MRLSSGWGEAVGGGGGGGRGVGPEGRSWVWVRPAAHAVTEQ